MLCARLAWLPLLEQQRISWLMTVIHCHCHWLSLTVTSAINSHIKIACEMSGLQFLCENLWAFWQPRWCSRLSCRCQRRTPASLCQMPLVPVAFLLREKIYIDVMHISHILYTHIQTHKYKPSWRRSCGNSHFSASYCSLSQCSSRGPSPWCRMIGRYSVLPFAEFGWDTIFGNKWKGLSEQRF